MLIHSETEYEDLLGQWSDLESGLGVILGNPGSSQEFVHRVLQYDRWMQGLMLRDPDAGLYLLFQLAGNSPVGYSASHALVCATLCHLIAAELDTAARERDSLVHAALTMNIGMTRLQDVLARQAEKPSPEQKEAIRLHAQKGAHLLETLGVGNELWLDIVQAHHNETLEKTAIAELPAAARLTRVLQVVDRYAAMISPRMSRAGRSATESARSVMANASAKSDPVAHALVKAVGLCPPGTYVRLDSEELAVVLRRSSRSNQPFVAIVGNANGELMAMPRLHATAQAAPYIRAALSASAVRAHVNHFHVLQLSAHASE
ncbi:MAG: HD-GYP domain-containing protein [Rhodoferax sp.]